MGKLELEELCDLCVCSLWGFQEVIRQYVVCGISSLESYFYAYVNFMALSFVSQLCYVFMNVCRFLIMHVRLVFEGGLATLYDMVWATCMHELGVVVHFKVLSYATESAMSLSLILV